MDELNLSAGEALVSRIAEDAASKAKKTVSEAKEYCERSIAAAKRSAEEISSAEISRANDAAALIIENKRTLSNIEVKKRTLTYRREIVESVYSRAERLLEKMKKAEYLRFIDMLVGKYAKCGDTVVLSRKAPVSESEVISLKNVSALSLKVEKKGEFGGGVILSGEKFDKDLTFSAIVEAVKDKTETETAKRLFDI